MTIDSPRIVLVTPVWNDAARLAGFEPDLTAAIRSSGLPVRWIVADDGSGEEEFRVLEQLVSKWTGAGVPVELLRCPVRSRKGGAVYAAWDRAVDADWLAFVDADGAIAATSLLRLIRKATEHRTSVVGIRRNAPGTPVRRTFFRNLSFVFFRRVSRLLLGHPFSDTQCGAKVIEGRAYRTVADRLVERGFAFDVELLLALDTAGFRVSEEPVAWTEKSGSKLLAGRDGWSLIEALLRIRKRKSQGWYSTPGSKRD